MHFFKQISIIRSSLITSLILGLTLFSPVWAQSTVDLVVHYVEGAPAEQEIGYDVSVFLSVVDSVGNPVKDLTAVSFTVTEDSQKVEISGLELASDDPINVVLVMDTSGSMSGPAIAAAKTAASNFIAALGGEDNVAVITFDDTVKNQIDYTTDHGAARQQVALIDAVRGAGTCLYDAAYQAIQMSATLPSGRRAVILFTDGVDEKSSGGTCSVHTPDDVIRLGSEGGTRTPVYTLGLGNRVNNKELLRLAELTGGRSLYSPDSSQLDAMFLRLSDQLRSQYKLTYISVAGPGAHTLAVSVTFNTAKDSDTRNFLLPAMPARISFVSPQEGDEVGGVIKISVAITGQGEDVGRIAFEINGEAAGSDDTTPYDLEVDLGSYAAGEMDITAVVFGANDAEMTRKSIKVINGGSVFTPTPTSTPKITTGLIVGGGIGALVLITAAIAAVFIIRRRSREKELDAAWEKAQSNDQPLTGTPSDERTYDGWEPSADALGMLIVTASDDASMIGHRFEITKSQTTLGRSADNDINFPKDSPVSRHHAQLNERSGGIYLSEMRGADNKAPTYGTFLNESQLGEDPVLLQTGDEIRLGKRVRLKFESAGRIAGAEGVTYDGLVTSDDDDRTREE
jgi:VWFA-related protein